MPATVLPFSSRPETLFSAPQRRPAPPAADAPADGSFRVALERAGSEKNIDQSHAALESSAVDEVRLDPQPSFSPVPQDQAEAEPTPLPAPASEIHDESPPPVTPPGADVAASAPVAQETAPGAQALPVELALMAVAVPAPVLIEGPVEPAPLPVIERPVVHVIQSEVVTGPGVIPAGRDESVSPGAVFQATAAPPRVAAPTDDRDSAEALTREPERGRGVPVRPTPAPDSHVQTVNPSHSATGVELPDRPQIQRPGAAAESAASQRNASEPLPHPGDRPAERPGRQRATHPSVSAPPAAVASAPASARAMQLDAALRLEQHLAMATGGPAPAGSTTVHLAMPSQPNVAAPTIAPAAPGEAMPLTHTARGDADPFIAPVVRGLSVMMSQRGGAMTMRLEPPELGQLRVQMTIVRGIVTAEFQASTPQAHGLIEQHIATLRSALERQGLTVERLTTLAPMPAAPPRAEHPAEPAHLNSGMRHEADAGQGESRGRHHRHHEDHHAEALFQRSLRPGARAAPTSSHTRN
jgi:hypothetical protein